MNQGPRVSLLQMFIMSFNAAVGVTMATLPRGLAETAKEDMWIPVIVGGVLFWAAVWIQTKLAAYFPRDTCIEYHRILLGPVLGQAANIVFLLLAVMILTTGLRTFARSVNMFLLSMTPPQVITAVLLLLLVYGVQYGLPSLLRLQQFLFVPNYFLFIALLLLGFMAVNGKNYQPVLAEGFAPVLKGIVPTWQAYTGPEFAIALLYPFVTGRKKLFRWVSAAIAALIVLYTLITVIVQGIIGSREAAYLLSPTIVAYRAVEIPDTYIERLDGYFMTFWIPIFITCMINWLNFVAFGIARMLKLESSRPATILLVPAVYYLVAAQPDFYTSTLFSKWTSFGLAAWAAGMFPLLLGLAWLREKRRSVC